MFPGLRNKKKNSSTNTHILISVWQLFPICCLLLYLWGYSYVDIVYMKNSGSIFTAKQTNNLIDKKLTKNDELEPLATFLSHKNQKGSR